MLLNQDAVGSTNGLSFHYWSGDTANSSGELRVFDGPMNPVKGVIYIYATIGPIKANPLRFVNGAPDWKPENSPVKSVETGAVQESSVPGGFVIQEKRPLPDDHPQFLQTIVIGDKSETGFTPVVRFGLADDRRAENKALVTAWVSDGHIDYCGLYVRPGTPYDFKIRIDLTHKRMTAWTIGRGDDEWFLLAEDVPLKTETNSVNNAVVEIYPGGPDVENLVVQNKTWREGEQKRPHPLAKSARAVKSGRGFIFQPMRSTWRKPGKHVTIFREPDFHAAHADVVQAGNDHLISVWHNGGHTDGIGGMSMVHSYDKGKTWEKSFIFTSLPGNCPRIQRLKDGKLLLIFDVPSSGDQYTATWDLVLWDSLDEGKTWTNERWLKTAKVGGGGCIVPSRICEMSDGSWLLAASYFAPPPNGGAFVEVLDYYRSKDHGNTWEFVSQPTNYPPSSLSEPSPVQLPDGKLVVYARESRTDGMPGAKGYSNDGGKTWKYQELSHPITGRTCAGLLKDGRVMMTYRSGVGHAALRAWVGDPNDNTPPQLAGAHFNDSKSVGLKKGALHIDNDGVCGQFTKYSLHPADTEKTVVDLTFEVEVLSNQRRAATVSIPFAGKLRIFPDHIEMFHDKTIRAEVAPGRSHTYHVSSRNGRFQLSVDGVEAIDTDKADNSLLSFQWTKTSVYGLEFGNEAKGSGASGEEIPRTIPDVYPANITSEVTGYSIWRRFDAVYNDPLTGRREMFWSADKDGFPDQYQLDQILEVEASANGHDQGYSGWTQLDDGRIFIAHYTDDTSAASMPNPHNFGVPWIRGTFLELSDLPQNSKLKQEGNK